MLKSRISPVTVMHTRQTPLHHTFRYRVFFFIFDLDEVPHLPRHLGCLFAYNHGLAPISLHDADYFSGLSVEDDQAQVTSAESKVESSIKAKLLRITTAHGAPSLQLQSD